MHKKSARNRNRNTCGFVEKESNIYSDAHVSGDARVYGNADYCCFQNFGSSNRTTTVFRESNNKIKIKCGCFSGTLEEFSKQVTETHVENEYGIIYKAIIEVIKLRFKVK